MRSLTSPEWLEYKQVIVEVMRNYEEARTDLIEALRRECGHLELAHDLTLALALDSQRPITMNRNSGP